MAAVGISIPQACRVFAGALLFVFLGVGVAPAAESTNQCKPSSVPSDLSSAQEAIDKANGSYLGVNGECVSLVKNLQPSVGAASTWQRGDQCAKDGNLQYGMPIATFTYDKGGNNVGYGNGGYYDPVRGGRSGVTHTAIYLGTNSDGSIKVLQQYNGRAPHIANLSNSCSGEMCASSYCSIAGASPVFKTPEGGSEQPKDDTGEVCKPSENDNKQESPAQAVANSILQNAGKCWACTIIVKAGEVTVQVIPKALENLTKPIMPLMAILFGIVTIFMVGRGFIWPGAMKWSEIFWNFMRFTAVWALLSTTNYASEYVLGHAFYPALQAGSEIGNIGSQQAQAAFKSQPSTRQCVFAPVDSQIPTEGRTTVEQMAKLACNVHNAAYSPVVAGAAMISYKFPSATASEIATAAVMTILAGIMIFASIFALAAFAMSVVEALLKLSVVLSLSPIILFFWIFRKTRHLSVNAFNALLYSFFLLAFSGLLASISSFVLGNLVAFGMGKTGTVSMEEVFNWINTEIARADVSQVALFGCFCIAGSMMASHLIRAGADMASSLTGVRMGQLTGNVMAGLNSIGQKALVLPAAGTGVLTTYAGAKAGAGLVGMGASGLGAIGKALAGPNGPLGKLSGLTVKN
jgi:hypothetical protein